MTDETLELALDLLCECESLAVHVRLVGDGQLSVVGPDAVLTEELLDRIRVRKSDLLEVLASTLPPLEPMKIGPGGWPAASMKVSTSSETGVTNSQPPEVFGELGATISGPPHVERGAVQRGDTDTPCHRCGSQKTVTVPIHNGKSQRMDCAECERFICWPVWNGKPMLPKQ